MFYQKRNYPAYSFALFSKLPQNPMTPMKCEIHSRDRNFIPNNQKNALQTLWLTPKPQLIDI